MTLPSFMKFCIGLIFFAFIFYSHASHAFSGRCSDQPYGQFIRNQNVDEMEAKVLKMIQQDRARDLHEDLNLAVSQFDSQKDRESFNISKNQTAETSKLTKKQRVEKAWAMLIMEEYAQLKGASLTKMYEHKALPPTLSLLGPALISQIQKFGAGITSVEQIVRGIPDHAFCPKLTSQETNALIKGVKAKVSSRR